jgi:hypothetical protein
MIAIPEIDLRTIIDNHKATAFKTELTADDYFFDRANEIYDTFDGLCELTLPKIKKLSEQDLKDTLDYAEQLQPLVTEYLDYLDDNYWECHNYDRLHSELSSMEEDLSKAISKMKKLSASHSK